jgi:hypothetical protein
MCGAIRHQTMIGHRPFVRPELQGLRFAFAPSPWIDLGNDVATGHACSMDQRADHLPECTQDPRTRVRIALPCHMRQPISLRLAHELLLVLLDQAGYDARISIRHSLLSIS